MTYNFKNDLESGLIVPVPIDLLQPTQIGLCKEKIEGLKRQESRQPVEIWPLIDGRYAIMSHTHTTYDAYKDGKTTIASRLTLPIDEEYMRSLGIELTNKDRADYQQLHERRISQLPSKINFIRSLGIHQISDLEKNIFETAGELMYKDNMLFNKYLMNSK